MTLSDTLQVLGGSPLVGSVTVRGAKNSVPKAMVAALLTDEECRVNNVPTIRDCDIVASLLSEIGCFVKHDDGSVTITASHPSLPEPDVLAGSYSGSRVPILTCAPLLHRIGKAMVYDSGGCAIGARPVDLHIAVLQAFGVKVSPALSGYVLETKGLHGARTSLSYPSVGATEQFLLGAVLAEGDSELENAAVEPEVVDLACVLQKMGAIVTILPGRTIRVTGVGRLHGFEHRCMPDRLEAASWACAALATNGRITVHGACQADMMTFLNVFRKAGGEFSVAQSGIEFYRGRTMLRPLAIETDVHPGFMTDWQAPLVTALTQADGVSVVHETVYEDRLGYASALNDLGANVQVFSDCLGPTPCRFGSRNHTHSAVVVGPTKLCGSEMTVPDLRAGFSYVLAALVAGGWSTIHGASVIDRGYEQFAEKLSALGVRTR